MAQTPAFAFAEVRAVRRSRAAGANAQGQVEKADVSWIGSKVVSCGLV